MAVEQSKVDLVLGGLQQMSQYIDEAAYLELKAVLARLETSANSISGNPASDCGDAMSDVESVPSSGVGSLSELSDMSVTLDERTPYDFLTSRRTRTRAEVENWVVWRSHCAITDVDSIWALVWHLSRCDSFIFTCEPVARLLTILARLLSLASGDVWSDALFRPADLAALKGKPIWRVPDPVAHVAGEPAALFKLASIRLAEEIECQGTQSARSRS